MAGARQFACKKEVNKKFRLTFVRLAFAWIVKKVGEKKHPMSIFAVPPKRLLAALQIHSPDNRYYKQCSKTTQIPD
jgi:hypothetical protein